MENKDKKEIMIYLKTQILMSLATSDGKGNLWSATVFVLADKDLNFYFLSNPQTTHCQNIAINPNVSFTVADSRQNHSSDKIGLQVAGKCTKVTGIKNLALLVKMWNSVDSKAKKKTLNDVSQVAGGRFYKITPKRIKFLNSLAEEKVREWEL